MLDCIIIGYNDVDFPKLLDSMEAMKDFSGAYRNMLNNTVLLRGRRLNYMELLSFMLTEATQTPHRLHTGKLPNLATCYLKSFLARRGFDVEIINFFNDEKQHLASLLERGTRAVAITTTFYVEPSPIVEIVNFVRKHKPQTKIIIGGPHLLDVCRHDEVTQDYLLETIGADIYIHDSQGESTLERVLAALRDETGSGLADISNLVFRRELKERSPHVLPNASAGATGENNTSVFYRSPREVENNNMDENAIDWSYFPPSLYAPTVQMRTARSCAFKCSFCKYPVIAGPLMLTSIDVVEKEMNQLHASGVRNLVFVDDTFNIPLRRFKQLLRIMIANEYSFNWFSFFRCSDSDDEAFDLMKESGCKGVFLGIESGDQGVLDNMNKHATLDKYKDGIRKLKDREIVTFASFIIGFPGETRQTVQNTIGFIEDCRPTYYRAETYFHSDNVPIQKKADLFDLTGGGYSWRHQTMDWKEACDWVDTIYKTVKGSIIFPLYMFDFWSIPYLLGKGISLNQVEEFARRSQRLLLRNIEAESIGRNEVEETTYEELLALSKAIARNLATAI